jgi:hypothetical protein
VRGGIISQANSYLSGFSSSQRVFPPQTLQMLLSAPAPGRRAGLVLEPVHVCTDPAKAGGVSGRRVLDRRATIIDHCVLWRVAVITAAYGAFEEHWRAYPRVSVRVS